MDDDLPPEFIFYLNSDDSLKDNLLLYFTSLLCRIYEIEDLDIFKKYNYSISIKSNYQCRDCKTLEESETKLNITEQFHEYLNIYIEFMLNRISSENLGYGLFDNIFGDWTDIDESIVVSLLPDDSIKKQELKKLLYVNSCLPLSAKGRDRFGGHGGFDYTPLEWFLSLLMSEIISYIIGIFVVYGINKGLGKIKDFIKGVKLKQIIRKKIKEKSQSWEDISLDEFEKYITFPKKFKGDKEEIIEEILKIKIQEYQERIISNIKNKKKIRGVPPDDLDSGK